jgi:predicted nucleic acid-binding protein
MVALVLEEQYSEAVRRLMDQWVDEATVLHAPLLAQYEVATVLTRKRTKKSLSKAKADEALEILNELDVVYHIAPNNARAIELAVAMKRYRASDAAYLALAEELGTVMWTLDGKLANHHVSRHLTMLID